MVHSIPTSVPTPLGQQVAQLAASRLLLHKSTSEDSTGSEATPPHFTTFFEKGVQGGENQGTRPSLQESRGGGARLEQEESIHTCTKAIASLCIDSEELTERGRGGARAPSSSSALFPESQQQTRSPSPHPSSPPQGPGTQHFSGLEVRPPYPSTPSSPHPLTPRSETLPPSVSSKPLTQVGDGDEESTNRSKDAS